MRDLLPLDAESGRSVPKPGCEFRKRYVADKVSEMIAGNDLPDYFSLLVGREPARPAGPGPEAPGPNRSITPPGTGAPPLARKRPDRGKWPKFQAENSADFPTDNDFRGMRGKDERKQAVVRPHQELPVTGRGQGPPPGTDPRVHHRQMNGAGREIAPGRLEHQGGGQNLPGATWWLRSTSRASGLRLRITPFMMPTYVVLQAEISQ